MNDVRNIVAFWGAIACMNVWAAVGRTGLAIAWFVLAVVIGTVSLWRGRK